MLQSLLKERRTAMKAEFYYDERTALQVALNSLLRYNKAMFLSIDEQSIDVPTISKFLKSTPNSIEERELAKLLIIAAKDTYLTHPDIPDQNKCRCALRGAKEFHMVLEASKNDYLRETGYFGVGLSAEEKYNERQKNNLMFRNAALAEMARQRLKKVPADIIKKQGVKTVAGFVGSAIGQLGFQSVAGGSLATIAASLGISTAVLSGGVALAAGAISVIAVDVIWAVIPDEMKKKAKDNAIRVIEKTGAQIEKSTKILSNTPIGKSVSNLYHEYVEPIIDKGARKIEEFYDKAKSKVKAGWTWLKSHFA